MATIMITIRVQSGDLRTILLQLLNRHSKAGASARLGIDMLIDNEGFYKKHTQTWTQTITHGIL